MMYIISISFNRVYSVHVVASSCRRQSNQYIRVISIISNRCEPLICHSRHVRTCITISQYQCFPFSNFEWFGWNTSLPCYLSQSDCQSCVHYHQYAVLSRAPWLNSFNIEFYGQSVMQFRAFIVVFVIWCTVLFINCCKLYNENKDELKSNLCITKEAYIWII